METIVRAACIYFFLMFTFRMAGRRTLAETSNFDLVLLLTISEATQNALMGKEDYSLTTAFLVIATFVLINIVLALLKVRFPKLDKVVEDQAVIIVENGKPKLNVMKACRIDVNDVMAAARQTQGVENLREVRYAVLEANGNISIIPEKTAVA